MSETQKKIMNLWAAVLTWAAVLGAVATAALSRFADAGLELPSLLASGLTVIVLVGRIASRALLTPRATESVLAVMLALLAAAGTVPQGQSMQPIDAPPIVVPADAPDVLPGVDAVEPEDPGPFANVIVGILGFGYGCSGAQQQVWQDAGTQLGKCLAGLGVQGADNLVTAWMGGEAVDAAAIGWDLLPGFLDCATRFGAYVFTGLVPVTTRDSVGTTMTPTARMLSALVEQGDPLALCGPRDGPPRCVIILPAP